MAGVGSQHTADADSTLLTVEDLRVEYKRRRARRGAGARYGASVAVEGAGFSIPRGKTLGLVGESGSGKTSVGLAVLGLIPAAGRVVFDGTDILGLRGREMRDLRKRMQIVFQNPSASLDPRMTIRRIVAEPLRAHRICDGNQIDDVVADLLERVALPSSFVRRHPHQLSGGQQQRVAIARALATSPDFIVCDEITSALDVSVQAQVLALLTGLQAELGVTLLFISHNLAVVRQVSDEVAVMYRGKIVERAEADELYRSPRHPYTRALLDAVPSPDPELVARPRPRRAKTLEVADAVGEAVVATGCPYSDRCSLATDICREVEPALEPIDSSHGVACHHSAATTSAEARA